MGVDYIDLYSLYSPRLEDLTEELRSTLLELKRDGKIKAIGIAAYQDDAIEKARKDNLFDVFMINYNIARQEREPLIEELAREGKGIMAGQALAEGLFHKDLFHIRSKKDLWYLLRTFGRKTSRELYKKAKKFRFLNKLDMDGSQVVLKYVLDNPYVSSAVFGSVDKSHIQKNVEALGIAIPEEVLKRIKSIG